MPFIISTWSRGQLYGDAYFADISPEAYYANFTPYIEKVLQHSEITVGCLDDDADVIINYVVHKGPVVIWAFTKKAWRGQGLMRQLCAGLNFSTYASKTKPGIAIAKKYKLNFNPWSTM